MHTTPLQVLAYWEFFIFVIFSTFQDEMQYIFLEKNSIYMVRLLQLLKVTSNKAMQISFLLFRATKMLYLTTLSLTSTAKKP